MASRRDFLAVAGASALAGCSNLLTGETPADTLIVNGRIATLDPKQPNAEAIAIRGERIVASRQSRTSLRSSGVPTPVSSTPGGASWSPA